MKFSTVLLAASIFILTGCFSGPPVVEITQGGSTVTSGQILSLAAVLTEPDSPADFTFQWYIDGTAVGGAVADNFSYTVPVVTEITSLAVKVSASSAARGTAEAEIAVTVLPSNVTHLSGSGSFVYSVDLGANPLSVYFIFTNGGDAEAARPEVTPNFSVSKQIIQPSGELTGVSSFGNFPEARRGLPGVTEFNHNPPPFEPAAGDSARSLLFDPPGEPLLDIVGDTGVIYDRDLSIAAACRKTVDADGKRLNIWVADAHWGAGDGMVTQAMVDALAEKFMQAGADNDIYNWVTGIFGAEWGSHGFSNLIAPDDEVTILLYDIGGDGIPNSGGGRTVGLFDSINNYTKASQSRSNERLMFFIDAPVFADDGVDGVWSITDDFWPNQVVSTLAHEFQHMIHFYQKAVKNSLYVTADIWINEMCSMAAEDLTADKLQVYGPRGVSYDDGTAGAAGNTSDRLARYNYYNDSSLTYWPPAGASASDTLPHYSLSYSFGAYLARNYGGPLLFQNIVQNFETDSAAVTSALAEVGTGITFTGILQRWGAAVLLSDITSASDYYHYNRNGFFTFSHNGITYKAGSVNLFNYYFNESGEQQSGPKFYTSAPVGQAVLPPASNTYYHAGAELAGTKSWSISIPDSVKMSVVFK